MYSLEAETIINLFYTEVVLVVLSVVTMVLFMIVIYGMKYILEKIRIKLIIRKMEKLLKADIENNKYIKDECTICFEENKRVLKSKCRHVMCKECWITIIIKIKTCPFCRGDIDIRNLQYIKKTEK